MLFMPHKSGAFIMPAPLTTADILKRIDCEGGLNTCWPWLSTKQSVGYGVFGVNSKLKLAHRWSYEFYYGKSIEKNYVVRHVCDNPACCNPLHLITGTQKQNIQDAYDRKRRVHPWKMTKETLIQLYELKEQGFMNKEIAQKLCISRQVVSKYLQFKKEVPADWRCRLDQLIRFEK